MQSKYLALDQASKQESEGGSETERVIALVLFTHSQAIWLIWQMCDAMMVCPSAIYSNPHSIFWSVANLNYLFQYLCVWCKHVRRQHISAHCTYLRISFGQLQLIYAKLVYKQQNRHNNNRLILDNF